MAYAYHDEWNWLIDHCTLESATQNGVEGFKFISNETGYEGNSIFLPASGFYYGSSLRQAGTSMRYWGSIVSDGEVSYNAFFVSQNTSGLDARCLGFPVRAVCMPRVPLTSFSLSSDVMTLGVELKQRIYTNCEPSNATECGAIWTSSNEAVAKVDCGGEVTGIAPGNAVITAVSVDGGMMARCAVTVIPSYVDMGGGMEWATFNVGAETATEVGYHFAWGEVNTKASYTWNNYLLGTESNIRYYNSTDGLVQLLPNRDAATVRLGGQWHTPSDAEWTWLKQNCTWTWEADYQNSGMAGYTVESNETGGIIFLPAAGYIRNDELLHEGVTGIYWSSSVVETDFSRAHTLFFQSGNQVNSDESRYLGGSIRAVRRKWVDMGDGLKWATTNVGGFNPEDYGDYFAWGEIKTKEDYSWSTYKWGTSSTALTKYVTDEAYGTVDNTTELVKLTTTTDDAARANWGATWRMPTFAEWTQLLNNSSSVWTTENGVYGRRVTSNTTGNSIFLPAAGGMNGTSVGSTGSRGYYWSSSLYTSDYNARCGFFDSSYMYMGFNYRYYGFPVRPVSD